MKTKDLKIDLVCRYINGQTEMLVHYYGMTEDKYVFIPFDINKKHFIGRPNGLTEKEVINHIKPMA